MQHCPVVDNNGSPWFVEYHRLATVVHAGLDERRTNLLRFGIVWCQKQLIPPEDPPMPEAYEEHSAVQSPPRPKQRTIDR
jgi:hypothetical protein